MADQSNIVSILLRYSKREELTHEERLQLARWLEASQANQILFDELSDQQRWGQTVADLKAKDDKATWKIIEQRISGGEGYAAKVIRWQYWLAAAAVLLIVIMFAEWLLNQRPKQKSPNLEAINSTRYHNDIVSISSYPILSEPGKSDQVLDPPGLQTINASGLVADSNHIQYGANAPGADNNERTLSTPKATTYAVQLSDGTKVWLDAASSLTFPARFEGPDRSVTLTGEGYFEVAKNPAKPFIMHVKNQSVQVMGTHFNVNAYNDVHTTLLEGKVRLSSGSDAILLQPDQQASLEGGTKFHIVPADSSIVLAWRFNQFAFQRATYPEIMQSLASWYPMQVFYQGTINDHFTGILPRTQSLKQLLTNLEQSGHVQFSISGDSVTVKPL